MSGGLLQYGIKSQDYKEVTVPTIDILVATCHATAGRVSFTGGQTSNTTATLVTSASSTFVITNNRVTPNSQVVITNTSANDSLGTVGWMVDSVKCSLGNFTVIFRNVTAGTLAAASHKFDFQFFVLNGAVL